MTKCLVILIFFQNRVFWVLYKMAVLRKSNFVPGVFWVLFKMAVFRKSNLVPGVSRVLFKMVVFSKSYRVPRVFWVLFKMVDFRKVTSFPGSSGYFSKWRFLAGFSRYFSKWRCLVKATSFRGHSGYFSKWQFLKPPFWTGREAEKQAQNVFTVKTCYSNSILHVILKSSAICRYKLTVWCSFIRSVSDSNYLKL